MDMSLANAFKVYSGKNGTCMCGCAGKYATASQHKAYAAADCGYETDDISDRSVKIMYNKVMKNENRVVDGNAVFAVSGNRIHVVYFKKAK